MLDIALSRFAFSVYVRRIYCSKNIVTSHKKIQRDVVLRRIGDSTRILKEYNVDIRKVHTLIKDSRFVFKHSYPCLSLGCAYIDSKQRLAP